jgi:hypothetical protein
MQTSLPDLPFTNYGKAELRPSCVHIHSYSESTPRTYPRTDLETLTPWTSFPNDIHRAIQSATTRAGLPSTPLHLGGYTETTLVTNEEAIRAHAMFALHVVVQKLMQRFGIDGYFGMPSGGHTAIVGDPDFLWVSDIAPHPKLIVSTCISICVPVVNIRLSRLSTRRGGQRI